MYIISQSLSNVEELKKIKTEEAVKMKEINRFSVEDPYFLIYKPIDIEDPYYTNLQEANK